MKKHLKRALSLFLVLTLVVSAGIFQSATPVAAATNVVSSVQTGRTYMIRNAATGLFMTALDNDTVEQRDFTGGNNQQWVLFPNDNSIWYGVELDVRPLSNLNIMLDVEGITGGSGTPVNVRDARTALPTHQMWRFLYQNNGTFRIQSVRDDRVVGLEGNRTVLRDNTNSAERQWEIIIPGIVTYNVARNGGTSAAPAAASLFEGAAVNLSPTASRPGWEFVGWNTNPDATTGLSSLAMGNTNITLYAIFRQTGSVNFVDYNNTTRTTRNVPFTIFNTATGVTITAPAQNNAVGLTARGWAVGTAGNAPVVAPPAGGPVPIAATYYGLYEAPITVSFDVAGGNSATPPPQTAAQLFNAFDMATPVNPAFTMPAAPTRDRHTFGGWTDGTYLYPAWANVPFSQNTTLLAHWNEIRVDGIGLSQYNLIMGEGDTATLQAFVSPANATFPEYVWSSSDETVATVDQNGNVTAISSGVANITATTVEGSFTASSVVTVMFIEYPVASIAISQNQAQLVVGDNLQLSAEVSPANATVNLVEWSSSNTAVATVDANGFVQSVGVGTAIISARSVQGGLQAACAVVVVAINVTGVTLNHSENTLAVGETAQLNATVLPENATNQAVNWASANNAIASVDQNGLVTAHSVGVVEVAAITEDGGHVATSMITVTNLVVSITLSHDWVEVIGGQQLTLEATVLPLDAANRSVTWTSSNPGVAQVNAIGFVMTNPVNVATAVTITATANDGSGLSAEATVVVVPVPVVSPGEGWGIEAQALTIQPFRPFGNNSSWRLSPFFWIATGIGAVRHYVGVWLGLESFQTAFRGIFNNTSQVAERQRNHEMRNQAIEIIDEHERVWATLNNEQRQDRLIEMLRQAEDILGIPRVNIIIFNYSAIGPLLGFGPNTIGGFYPGLRTILINQDLLADPLIIRTIFHEARHVYQFEARLSPWSYPVSNQTLHYWEHSRNINPTGGMSPEYLALPIEWDARHFSGDNHIYTPFFGNPFEVTPVYNGNWY